MCADIEGPAAAAAARAVACQTPAAWVEEPAAWQLPPSLRHTRPPSPPQLPPLPSSPHNDSEWDMAPAPTLVVAGRNSFLGPIPDSAGWARPADTGHGVHPAGQGAAPAAGWGEWAWTREGWEGAAAFGAAAEDSDWVAGLSSPGNSPASGMDSDGLDSDGSPVLLTPPLSSERAPPGAAGVWTAGPGDCEGGGPGEGLGSGRAGGRCRCEGEGRDGGSGESWGTGGGCCGWEPGCDSDMMVTEARGGCGSGCGERMEGCNDSDGSGADDRGGGGGGGGGGSGGGGSGWWDDDCAMWEREEAERWPGGPCAGGPGSYSTVYQ
jgi:hypothetical protein